MFPRIAVCAVLLAGIATPALADRDATLAEVEKIIPVLKTAGYVSWEEIEIDDDGPYFEVDDARKSDGSKWDLKLSTTDYRIVKAEHDD